MSRIVHASPVFSSPLPRPYSSPEGSARPSVSVSRIIRSMKRSSISSNGGDAGPTLPLTEVNVNMLPSNKTKHKRNHLRAFLKGKNKAKQSRPCSPTHSRHSSISVSTSHTPHIEQDDAEMKFILGLVPERQMLATICAYALSVQALHTSTVTMEFTLSHRAREDAELIAVEEEHYRAKARYFTCKARISRLSAHYVKHDQAAQASALTAHVDFGT